MTPSEPTEKQRQPLSREPHPVECSCELCKRDIVQVQKEAWARIAQEERERKRQPPVLRWSAHDRYMERIFHAF